MRLLQKNRQKLEFEEIPIQSTAAREEVLLLQPMYILYSCKLLQPMGKFSLDRKFQGKWIEKFCERLAKSTQIASISQ